jgi:hypothetical protein
LPVVKQGTLVIVVHGVERFFLHLVCFTVDGKAKKVVRGRCEKVDETKNRVLLYGCPNKLVLKLLPTHARYKLFLCAFRKFESVVELLSSIFAQDCVVVCVSP